jgi:hypothetical protein
VLESVKNGARETMMKVSINGVAVVESVFLHNDVRDDD